MTIRSHLILLAIGAVLPVFVFAIVVSAVLAAQDRHTVEQAATERARAMMTAVDAELRGSITTLVAIAVSPALSGGDLRAFHDEAQRILATQPGWLDLRLANASGQIVVDAREPFGATASRPYDPASVEAALRSSHVVVGNVDQPAASSPAAVPIRAPVLTNDRVAGCADGRRAHPARRGSHACGRRRRGRRRRPADAARVADDRGSARRLAADRRQGDAADGDVRSRVDRRSDDRRLARRRSLRRPERQRRCAKRVGDGRPHADRADSREPARQRGQVHVARRHDRVGVARDGGSALLTVADDGEGIAPELVERVFDVFVQGDQDVGRSKGGIGLGLTLVKRLAELQGGTVAASSAGVGRGTTFVVRMPEATASPPLVAAAVAPHAGSPRSIVIIEDNDDARDMLQQVLSMQGHVISESGSGEAGAALVVELQPDVAIIDIGLPDIDGYEVARRVRAQSKRRVALIALTGYGQPEDVRRAHAAGFDVHLVKPVSVDRLDAAIASVTGTSSSPLRA